MSPTGSSLRPARALRGAMGSCEERQRPPFNSSAGAGLARPPGPQALPGSGSVLSSQSLAPSQQSPLPFKPSGAPDPTSHSQMFTFLFCTPMLASGLLGGSLHSIRQLRIPGSRAHFAPTGPWSHAYRPPPQRHPAASASSSQHQLPTNLLAQCRTQAEPTKCLCTHDPYTSSQHTSTPFSKHTKSTCASQTHKSDSHRCSTHV